MAYVFKNLLSTREHEKIIYIHKLLFLVVYLTIIAEFFWHFQLVEFVLKLFIVPIFYRFYLNTLKNLHYTFWTFSIFFIIYLLFELVFNSSNIFIFSLFLISVFILVIELYIISSPIYYPRVQWWEYDFRFRGDLRAKINFNEKMYEGRVSDLRRGCMNVICFEQINIGTDLEVLVFCDDREFSFKGKVQSQRLYLPGRGYHHGIKIQLDNKKLKKIYSELMDYNIEQRQGKIKKRFEKKVG